MPAAGNKFLPMYFALRFAHEFLQIHKTIQTMLPKHKRSEDTSVN